MLNAGQKIKEYFNINGYYLKLNATNQSSESYELKGQTVGFTFGHMLSKLQINLQANDTYSGITSLKVTNLSIENMPASASTKASFTQTSPTAPAGAYTPANYTSTLSIIGTNGTSTADLYILKNGSMSGETVTAPTAQNQSFNYYVAPNVPTGTGTDQQHQVPYEARQHGLPPPAAQRHPDLSDGYARAGADQVTPVC